MVHESLRELARLLQVPEEFLGVGREYLPNTLIRKSASAGFEEVDPVKILELDFLRWLIVVGRQEYIESAQRNIHPEDLQHEGCRRLYHTYLTSLHNHLPNDLLSLIQTEEDQELVAELMNRKVDQEKGNEQFLQSVQHILDRNWMEKREEIRRRIHSGQLNDDEALALLKKFDELKRNKPEIKHAAASPVL